MCYQFRSIQKSWPQWKPVRGCIPVMGPIRRFLLHHATPWQWWIGLMMWSISRLLRLVLALAFVSFCRGRFFAPHSGSHADQAARIPYTSTSPTHDCWSELLSTVLSGGEKGTKGDTGIRILGILSEGETPRRGNAQPRLQAVTGKAQYYRNWSKGIDLDSIDHWSERSQDKWSVLWTIVVTIKRIMEIGDGRW